MRTDCVKHARTRRTTLVKIAGTVLLVLLAGSGLDAQEPVSPPECARADSGDADADGLADACELGLAQAFAPVLLVRSGGCNWERTRGRLGGGYRFAVRPLPGGAMVAYLPAYFHDCGWSGAKCWLPWVSCAPHAGDSEFIAMELAKGDAGWSAVRVFLSAHCFGRSGASCRWYDGEELAGLEWQGAAPVVWVAEGRQANYRSKAECDAGHHTLDTCDHHDARFRFPVESGAQNIGSARHADAGCVSGSALGMERVSADVRECFWDTTRRFTGWQANARGVTGYWRYLGEVAGFVLPPAGTAFLDVPAAVEEPDAGEPHQELGGEAGAVEGDVAGPELPLEVEEAAEQFHAGLHWHRVAGRQYHADARCGPGERSPLLQGRSCVGSEEPAMSERKELLLAERTSVAELADLMGAERDAVIRAGFDRGLLLTIFQELRFEECRALAAQFGYLARRRDP